MCESHYTPSASKQLTVEMHTNTGTDTHRHTQTQTHTHTHTQTRTQTQTQTHTHTDTHRHRHRHTHTHTHTHREIPETAKRPADFPLQGGTCSLSGLSTASSYSFNLMSSPKGSPSPRQGVFSRPLWTPAAPCILQPTCPRTHTGKLLGNVAAKALAAEERDAGCSP